MYFLLHSKHINTGLYFACQLRSESFAHLLMEYINIHDTRSGQLITDCCRTMTMVQPTCPSTWFWTYPIEYYRWPGVVVSMLASINEVNQRRAQLVLRWVTISGFNFWWGTFISVCGQPPRSTQPGHPFVVRRNEYQPKGRWCLVAGE